MHKLKSTHERVKSQACLSFSEREGGRRSQPKCQHQALLQRTGRHKAGGHGLGGIELGGGTELFDEEMTRLSAPRPDIPSVSQSTSASAEARCSRFRSSVPPAGAPSLPLHGSSGSTGVHGHEVLLDICRFDSANINKAEELFKIRRHLKWCGSL